MRIRKKSGGEGRRRFSPMLWGAGLAALALLVLGITGTLAQFTASITNPDNNVQTVGPEAFDLSESLLNGAGEPIGVPGGQVGDAPCVDAQAGNNSAECPFINKYGEDGVDPGPIAPGGTHTTSVQLKNTGTSLTGTLTLHVSPCTQSPVAPGVANPNNGSVLAGDLCSAMLVTVSCSPPATADVFGPPPTPPANTLTVFASGTAPGGNPYTIGTLPPQATTDCTFTVTLPSAQSNPNLQGLTVNQPLMFTLTQV